MSMYNSYVKQTLTSYAYVYALMNCWRRGRRHSKGSHHNQGNFERREGGSTALKLVVCDQLNQLKFGLLITKGLSSILAHIREV